MKSLSLLVRTTTKLTISLLLLLSLPRVHSSTDASSRSIAAKIIQVEGDTLTLDCGLSSGVSVGDSGIIYYEVRIGDVKRRVKPASFTIIQVFSNTAIGKISQSTGLVKTSYSAEIELAQAKPVKEKIPGAAAENKAAGTTGDVSEALALLQTANSLYENGELEAAKIAYKKILTLIPDDPFAKSRLQAIEEHQNERKRALVQLAYFKTAASSAMHDGDYELARSYCEKALAISPHDSQAGALLEAVGRKIEERIYLSVLPKVQSPVALLNLPEMAAIAPPVPLIKSPTGDSATPAHTAAKEAPAETTQSIAKPQSGDKHLAEFASLSSDSAMILVAVGDFLQGEPRRTAKFRNEMPEHPVHLNAFLIDKFEVTRAMYKKFVDPTHHLAPDNWEGANFSAETADLAVTRVSWYDADAYCRFVQKRLPSEAEWEYAAKGSKRVTYPWGDEFNSKFTNTSESGYGVVLPVSQLEKDRSPFGAVGLGGNVSEWTEDWYLPYPQNRTPEMDYGQRFKVVRGGSFKSPSYYARATFRGYRDPQSPADDIGFRCAKPASPPVH